MARFRYLIFALLFLSSCAQVGNISGGEEDFKAPRPIADKISPANETTYFTFKEVEIPFDEFIKLNNPSENIRIVPPHANLTAKMKGKSLFLSWEEDLKPNTTYAIYLNNAVKDITEGNDTIIQYVFSTGAQLDSLKYAVKVVDAWTDKSVENAVVALYDAETDSIQNFTSTSKNGEALLNYIRPGRYKLLAFIDENRDLIPQSHEKVGFQSDSILEIKTSVIDTIPLRIFKPLKEPKINSATHAPSNNIVVGTTRPLKDELIYVNNLKVDRNEYVKVEEDSLIVFLPPSDSLIYRLIIQSPEINDTVSVRPSLKNSPGPVVISTKKVNNAFNPSDTVCFYVNDLIQKIDTSKISVFNTADSSFLPLPSFILERNKICFFIDKKPYTNLDFKFEDGAVTALNGKNINQTVSVSFTPHKKLGALSLDLGHYTEALLVQLYLNGKENKLIEVYDPSKKVVVEELTAGDYTFKVIHDKNNNKKWDTGSLALRKQPELIDLFTTPTKLRANWEVEVLLLPTKHVEPIK